MIKNLTTIESKDWARMRDLIIKGKDGTGVANSIKDVRKACARFVTGNILNNVSVEDIKNFYYKHRSFKNSRGAGIWFEDFGNQALELGAKIENIVDMYEKATIPASLDTSGLPISDEAMSERNLRKTIGLEGVIKEIKVDDFMQVKFV